MIDFDDSNDAWFLSLFVPWWVALPLAILALILFFVAMGNADDCAQKHCATGTPRLMENQCLCVEAAK